MPAEEARQASLPIFLSPSRHSQPKPNVKILNNTRDACGGGSLRATYKLGLSLLCNSIEQCCAAHIGSSQLSTVLNNIVEPESARNWM